MIINLNAAPLAPSRTGRRRRRAADRDAALALLIQPPGDTRDGGGNQVDGPVDDGLLIVALIGQLVEAARGAHRLCEAIGRDDEGASGVRLGAEAAEGAAAHASQTRTC